MSSGVPPIEIEATLSSSKYKKGLKEMEQATARSTDKIEKDLDGVTDSTNKVGESIEKNSRAIGSSFKSVAGGLAVFEALKGIASSAIGAMRDAFTAADNFNKKVAELNTVLPATGQFSDDLRDKMYELARTFGTSAADQAGAFYQIISAGIEDTGTALETLAAANRLATAGLGNVETAILGLTKIINNYGTAAGNAEEISNVLFTAVKNGQVNVEQFSSTLPKVLAEANALGISFIDASAALTALSNTSESADIAATQLKAVFVALARQIPVLSKITDENGIAFDRQSLATKGLANYLRDLVRVTKDQTGLMKAIGGSSEAMSAILKFAADDFKALNKNVNDFNNSAGVTDDALEKIQQASQFDLLVNNVKLVASEIGGALVPALQSAAKWLNILFFEGAEPKMPQIDELKNRIKEIDALFERAANRKRGTFGGYLSTREREALTQEREDLLANIRMIEKKAELEKKASIAKARMAAEEKARADETARIEADKKATAALQEKKDAIAEYIESIRTSYAEIREMEQVSTTDQESPLASKLDSLRAELEQERVLKLENDALKIEDEQQFLMAVDNLKTQARQLELTKTQKQYEKEKKGKQAFDNAMLSLQNSNLKALAVAGKAYALWQHGKNTVEAVSNSYAWGSSWGGPPGGAAMAALAAAAMAAQAAQIAGIKGFANGGVIGGSMGATSGKDDQLATVRTGEMVLNAEQQESLFNAINSGNLGGGELRITFDENKFMDAFDFEFNRRVRQGRSGVSF